MVKKYLVICLAITLLFMTAFVANIAVAETKVTSGHDYHYTGTLNINAGTGHIDADWLVAVSYNGVLIPEPMENRINAIEPGRVELNVDPFWFPIDSRFSKFFSADL